MREVFSSKYFGYRKTDFGGIALEEELDERNWGGGGHIVDGATQFANYLFFFFPLIEYN